MERVCVVAFWGGQRRYGGCQPWENVQKWEQALEQYKHNIDLLCLVSNRSEEDDDRYLKALMQFKSTIPVVILRRDNVNGSYGAWKYAWTIFGDRFKLYYIFEDDYVPATDHWDDKLAWCMWQQASDYCGARLSFPQYEEHMGHACGLITETALTAVNVDQHHLHPYAAELQISFGRDVIAAGYKLCDFAGQYRVPFGGDQFIHEIGNEKAEEALMVPTSIWTPDA